MKKIKYFIESKKGKDFLTIIIIILTSLGSFQLGKMSIEQEVEKSKINITYPELEINNKKLEQKYEYIQIDTMGKNYLASSRGSKYYPISCSAGKNIKQDNKIYFNTKEEAENAGYSLSSSCK